MAGGGLPASHTQVSLSPASSLDSGSASCRGTLSRAARTWPMLCAEVHPELRTAVGAERKHLVGRGRTPRTAASRPPDHAGGASTHARMHARRAVATPLAGCGKLGHLTTLVGYSRSHARRGVVAPLCKMRQAKLPDHAGGALTPGSGCAFV